MSKIFRLHEGGSNNIEDWSITSHLSDHLIDAIKDPDGGISKKPITSIPSPFAKYDLVRTAYKQIVSSNKLEGLTAYHRLVSKALDVGELFFNANALKDQIEIIPWDPGIEFVGGEMTINHNSDLGRLLHAQLPGHRLLGETLQLFLKQDSQAFNFDKLQQIYLINYIGKGSGFMNIIGSTSPLTIFAGTANDVSNIVDISFGSVKLFGDVYTPLFKRDPDFVRYIYSLKNFYPQFSSRFKELDEYLEMNFHLLPNSLRQDIKQIDRSMINEEYDDIALGHAGYYVEVLGERLKTNRPEIEKIEKLSEFVIDNKKELQNVKPLVLPNKDINETLYYVKGNWQSNYHAPFSDPRPLNERTLPIHGYIQYPYITADDFLQPNIFKFPYPINQEKFFNGYFDHKEYSFSIPLKKEYFRYFSTNDIQKRHADGKRYFELLPANGNAITAVLRIPIKNNKYIEFSRTYYDTNIPLSNRNADGNSGNIVDAHISLAVFPFLKTNQTNTAHYRVMLVDTDQPNDKTITNFQLSFFDEKDVDHQLPIAHKNDRSVKGNEVATTRFHALNKEFDFIEINQNNNICGLLIPMFTIKPQGASQFSFAIDFGTTNTHIEFKMDKGSPRPFEINANEILIGSTIKNDVDNAALFANWKLGKNINLLKDLLPVDFLPEQILKGQEYCFPIRTVIAEQKGIDVNQPTFTLADFTIPFAYEKISSPSYINTTSNLKWSDFKSDPARKRSVEAFIEELLLLIRNKVLMNGGSLDFTKIIWSYPSSMSEFKRNTLENAWIQFTRKYISSTAKVNKISESVAPFYYFRTKEGVLAYDKPVVNIDIGGGTSDIVIFQNDKPISITSFRFASNAIFGDGYGNAPSVNGFVQKYYPLIRQKLLNNELFNLEKVMEQISQSDSSDEIIAFFFSLENNKVIRDGNYPIAFSKELKEDVDFKLVFVFFHAAIMYHLAKLMKAKNLLPPRHILFSGMGSKVINIADTGFDLKNLTEYTNLIFKDVYGAEQPINIELKQYEEPKEITCKGGLMCEEFTDTDNVRTVLSGSINQVLIPDTPLRYSQIGNDELLNSVKEEVSTFIDKFFGWNEQYYYPKKFGVNPSSLNVQKQAIKDDVLQFLMAGVKEKLTEEKDNMELMVEETLFFYPLRGILHKMAKRLHNLSRAEG